MSEINITYDRIKSDVASLYKIGMRRIRHGDMHDATWYLGRLETWCQITNTRELGPLLDLNAKICRLSSRLYNAIDEKRSEQGTRYDRVHRHVDSDFTFQSVFGEKS